MGASLTDDDLLPGEELVLTKFANLWVRPSEHGLSDFAFGALLPPDSEALGGKAHLTNYRFLFKPHGLNRLTGKSSIFLPNVRGFHKGWFGLKVVSQAQQYDFVMWFNGRFAESARQGIQQCKRAKELARLREAVRANPERVGKGLKAHRVFEALNRVLASGLAVADVSGQLGELSLPDRRSFLELVTLFEDD